MMDMADRVRLKVALRALHKVAAEHGVFVDGCGCCDSPILMLEEIREGLRPEFGHVRFGALLEKEDGGMPSHSDGFPHARTGVVA